MQLAVDVQIPEILGGMNGETVYIGMYMRHSTCYRGNTPAHERYDYKVEQFWPH